MRKRFFHNLEQVLQTVGERSRGRVAAA